MHDIDNAAMLLPSELKHHIGTFCTPCSLASLAQVHTSYRQEAERVLYKKIYLYIWKHLGEMRCLDTLSSNLEKAAFVHSLTVEFPSNWNKNRDESLRAVVALSSALRHMPALSDLRIRLPNGQLDDPSPERITDSLHHQHSQLHTLCCNDYLDIPAIVENQRQLQVLGIYSNGRFLPDLLKRLEALPISLPTVFAMERNSALPTFNHLQIFPALPTSNFQACGAIAEAIHSDVSRQMILETTRVVQMSIWLKDFSEITFIRDIVEDMIIYFPHIAFLDFLLQHPSRTVQPEIKTVLSAVTELRELDFYFWDLKHADKDESWVIPVSQKQRLAHEWMAGCPELWQVQFLDGFTVSK